MAERRTFAKSIIFSDRFWEMPPRAQLLYFNMSLEADDDGFVGNPRFIQRMTCATDDEMQQLVDQGYIFMFQHIVVIRHWRINNSIKADRYKPTRFQAERALLTLTDGVYERIGAPRPEAQPKVREPEKTAPARPAANPTPNADLPRSPVQAAALSPYSPAGPEDAIDAPDDWDDEPMGGAGRANGGMAYRPAQADAGSADRPGKTENRAGRNDDRMAYRPNPLDDDLAYHPVRSDDHMSYNSARPDDDLSYHPARNDDNLPYRPNPLDDDLSYHPVRSDDHMSYNPEPNASRAAYAPDSLDEYWTIPSAEFCRKARENAAKSGGIPMESNPVPHSEPNRNPYGTVWEPQVR